MAFNSLSFLLFFPIAVLGYYVIPQKGRNLWLLVLSYYFYMCWNASYALLILFSTVSTYLCAGLISRVKDPRRRKLALGLNIGVNLGILFLFKYYQMFVDLLAQVLEPLGIAFAPAKLSLLLPVGISFYTFQALGYSIDVYRGTVKHEKNFLNYALFVSFFPQLVAGPIERSERLLPQFREVHPYRYENVAQGLRIMLLGFFKKVVIADNAAIAVDRMYTYLDVFPGPVLVFGIVLFAIQVYCDFAGYSDIAVGAAKVMGFDLMRNFDHPYFSHTLAEFWSRWHISLSTWLQDYVFEPLVWSKWTQKLPVIGKYIHTLPTYSALVITFLISGLWHGAAWTYVAWGALHGLMQVFGKLTKKKRRKLLKKLHVPTKSAWYRLLQQVLVFTMVCASYVFFRSATFGQAYYIFIHWFRGWGIFADPAGAVQAFVSLADSARITWIILLSTAALWLLELREHRTGKTFDVMVAELSLPKQWCIYYVMLFAIALFGAFGRSSFIYFQF